MYLLKNYFYDSDLSANENLCLNFIHSYNGLNMAHLSRLVNISYRQIQRICSKLFDLGYIVYKSRFSYDIVLSEKFKIKVLTLIVAYGKGTNKL